MIRRPSMRHWLITTTALAGALPLIGLTISIAHANPQGGTVAQGSATITQTDPKTVTINQSTDKAVINWQSFSIGAGETTRFNQPSSSSMTLNRVTGDQVSQILGNLQANGRVYLVNPNGIVFGAGSKIDVAALVASTANIKDSNFMAGNLRFDIPGRANAQIINEGSITAADGGLVALVAPSLRNSGIIQARLGRVALAAANGMTLDLYGDNLILFQASDKITQQVVGTDGQPVSALVENSGKIYADGGRVLMTANVAKGVVDNAINTTGLVSARTVEQQGGEIVLKGEDGGIVQVAGTLDASGKEAGQKGGAVNVLGDVVALQSSAKVDVSGDAGGGTALIGGDYLGGGTVRNADVSYMAKGAVIDASAINTGNGGKSILWANDTTRSYGSILARGGRLGGDGGFVETSGKVYLAQEGSVDASAPNGKAGTWLMDPGTVYIQDSVAESNTQNTGCVDCTGSYLYRAATSNPAYIASATINNALNAGNNVTIVTGSQDGVSDIHVEGNIIFTKGQGALNDMSLMLKASRDIYVTSGRILQTGSDSGPNDRADLNVYLLAAYDYAAGSVYIGDAARTFSTIDVGSTVAIQARTLAQIYTNSGAGVYTVNSSWQFKASGNLTPGSETNVPTISLGDRALYVRDTPGGGNVELWADALNLPNQGNGTAEIALSGNLTMYGASATNIEKTILSPRTNTSNSTTTTQQQIESSNVDSNNKERDIELSHAKYMMEYGRNIDGADSAQRTHNLVADYMRQINFGYNDSKDIAERTTQFYTVRSMIYDNIAGTYVEGRGYRELLSLIISGDIQPNQNNPLWRALMVGGQLSPAQIYVLESLDIMNNGINNVNENDGPTKSFSASINEVNVKIASMKIGADETIASTPKVLSISQQNAALDSINREATTLNPTVWAKINVFISTLSQLSPVTVGRQLDKLLASSTNQALKNRLLEILAADTRFSTDQKVAIAGAGKPKNETVVATTTPVVVPVEVNAVGSTATASNPYIGWTATSENANKKVKSGQIDQGHIDFPNNKSVTITASVGYDSKNTGYQCVDLVKNYIRSIADGGKITHTVLKIDKKTKKENAVIEELNPNAFSTGNGIAVSSNITGWTAGNMKFVDSGNGTIPPALGAIVSFNEPGWDTTGKVGHVAIIKGLQYNSDGTMTATLIEQNYGTSESGYSKNRTIVFTNENGVWSYGNSKESVRGWVNIVQAE